jgi:hypothetical protein
MLAKKVLLVCLEAVVIVSVIGCAPTIVSTDAGVYQNGTLFAAASKDLDSVYAATLFAMDKLQLQVTDKAKDVFAAKVVAKSADGKFVTVTMKPEGEQKTSYQIHIGAFGNEERARKIYGEINTGLAAVKTK